MSQGNVEKDIAYW